MPEALTHRATLGLGGNLGDPARAMADALQALDARDDCMVSAVSRLYRTPPWGKTDQADFFNACAELHTVLTPAELIALCLDIERHMKRVRDARWGPRTLDIDILTYDDLTLDSERLVIPHPRMLERGFVLMPLADFAGAMVVSGRPVSDWLQAADTTGIEIADGDPDWWRRA